MSVNVDELQLMLFQVVASFLSISHVGSLILIASQEAAIDGMRLHVNTCACFSLFMEVHVHVSLFCQGYEGHKSVSVDVDPLEFMLS